MKRVISIVLSIAVVLTMSAGLNLTAYAAEVQSIAFNPDSINVYEGWHGFFDEDESYYVYDFGRYDLLTEGNELEVTYDDESTETYTCTKIQRSEDENDYYLDYICGDKRIDIEELDIECDQSAENQWTLNNSYTAYVLYQNKKAPVTINIVENPVDSVTVNYERPITLVENGEGEQTDGDWFFYYANNQYLNAAGVTFEVHFKDNTVKNYAFFDNDWLPCEVIENGDNIERGEELEEGLFNFSFNQLRDDRHFYPGAQGRTATVTYYGKGLTDMPVNIVEDDAVLSTNINIGEHRKTLFIANETHSFAFTPAEDGVYVFEESLADNLVWNRDRFDGALIDSNNTEVQSLSNEMLIYALEGGCTYYLNASKTEEGGPCFEFLSVRGVNTTTGVTFNPYQPITVYEGNPSFDEAVFRMGNTLDVDFSNGETVHFLCDNFCKYIDGTVDNGVAIEEYRNKFNLEYDTNVHANANVDFWNTDGDNYFDIYVGSAYTRYYVDVIESPYQSVRFELANPLSVYSVTARSEHGHNSEGQWLEYQHYDFDCWALEQEGNKLIVTDLNGDEIVYECQRVEEERGGYLVFCNEEGDEIYINDVLIDTHQGPDNEWQDGETYDVDLYFKGQHFTVPVSVIESPVDSVNVNYGDRSIELFEETVGETERDDNDNEFFKYYEQYDYLRAINPTITVNFTDGSSIEYNYDSGDWIPHDSNDNPMDDRYFELRFDQYGDTHFAPDGENNAYLWYYGVYSNAIPVAVNTKHDIDEGSISVDDRKTMLFISDETHTFSFKPDNSGLYRVEEGIRHQVNYDGFTLQVWDVAANREVERLELDDDNDDIIYRLTANRTYEFRFARGYESNNTSFEYFRIDSLVSVDDFEYTHADDTDITVSEGEYGNGWEIYDENSTFEIRLSNGASEIFTANDRSEFRADDGRSIDDFFRDNDVWGDWQIHITPNMEPWQRKKVAYYTVDINGVSNQILVTVSASSVQGIVYHTASETVELVRDVDFVCYNGGNETYMRNEPFFDGDTVDVIYNDGRGTVTYKYNGGDEFENVDDWNDRIHLNYSFDSQREYNVGDTIAFTFSYQLGSQQINATVTESDVESVEFTPSQPYSVYKEYDGYWDHRSFYDYENDVQIDEDFFNYNAPRIFRRGNSFTVHYTDGTVAEYVYNGRWFIDEDGNRLANRYIRTVSRQWNNPWTEGADNEFYAEYKGQEAPVSVEVVDPGEWSLYAKAHDNRGFTYENGDTLYIEKGQSVFVYFETDYRNRDYNLTDYTGFSDGYDEGTLTSRGFDVQTGNDYNFGYDFGDTYGLMISTNNLRVGTSAQLYYYVYEDEDGDNNVDFVSAQHALENVLNIQIVDHRWTENEIIPATCTAMGYTEYTCELCGASYRGNFTPFAQHNYDAVETEATPNAKGYTTYTCTECGYAYIGDITGYASDDSALEAVVENSQCLEQGDYSSASYSALKRVISAASEIHAVENPQVEIDNAVSEVLTAITDLQPYLTFSAEGENGNVTGSVENGTYLQGTEITLTAAADDGYAFNGWYEKGTKRIFSTDTEYTFVLTSNTEFVALFVPQGTASLVFANKTGQIVETVCNTPAEWAEVTDLSALAPAVPYSYGCTNGAWDIPADALANLQSGTDVVITPVYDETGAFVPTATATDGKPAVNLWFTFDSSNSVGSFVMAVDIPDGVTVESIGTALYYRKAGSFNPTDFILTVNNKTATSKFDDLQSGVYVTNMRNMSSYYNWAVRGYVNYYDGAGNLKTAYSQQINIADRQQV